MESEDLQSSVDSCIADIIKPVNTVLVQRVQNALKKTTNCGRYESGLKAVPVVIIVHNLYLHGVHTVTNLPLRFWKKKHYKFASVYAYLTKDGDFWCIRKIQRFTKHCGFGEGEVKRTKKINYKSPLREQVKLFWLIPPFERYFFKLQGKV